jgi:hypothetical protein
MHSVVQAAPIQPRRALIATHHLAAYAGSEVFTLELATELREMGWEVCVATLLSGAPMVSEFEKQGFQVIDMLAEPLVLGNAKFDLVWIHHAPVLYEILIHGVEAATVVFCSLSHFEPLEAAPEHRELVDLLLAHSIENKNHIVNTSELREDQVLVFANAVPGNYWANGKKFHSPVLKHMAVISNHPPPEVLQAAKVFKQNGVEVVHIGTGGIETLINAKLLRNYDAVLTIGKTVPYCLALKIPVYCYDHFGGPGWLDEGNFDLAGQNNFSGRGFLKKTPGTIVREMTGGYAGALGRLDAHAGRAASSLHLRRNLEHLLAQRSDFPIRKLRISDAMPALKQHAQYMRLVKVLRDRQAEIEGLRQEVSRVKSAFGWRLASPFRVARNFLRRIKSSRPKPGTTNADP